MANANTNKEAKYIFYFIGDGMGITQAQLANDYLEAKHDKDTGLVFYTFPYRTIMTTHAHERYITGSAAAATALATGHKTSINTISKNHAHSCDIVAIPSVAKKTDFKTGIISSVFINHATPACFYAHDIHRSNYYEIALDLPKSGIDFFAGGGFKHPKGKEKDKKSAYEFAREAGYYIPNSFDAFLKAPRDKKLLFSTDVALNTGILKYRIDRQEEYPSLAQLTKKGIDYLDNDKGFFIMIEGGAIDWAGHANDAGTIIHETIDFDLSVREAFEFYKSHPDETLIIVTADHETGGLALGSAKTQYESNLPLIDNQKRSKGELSDSLKAVLKNDGDYEQCLQVISYYTNLNKSITLNDLEKKQLSEAFEETKQYLERESKEYSEIYGTYNPLAVTALKILAAKAGIGWTTYAHTAVQVPVYAIGAGAEKVMEVHDNTDLAKVILNIISGKPDTELHCK